MIEILLTIYIVCMIGSLILIGWHYWSTQRQLQSNALANLNKNLSQIDLFWSHTNGSFTSLNESSIEEDRRKALRNILWLLLLAFASLPGFLLLAAVIFSVRYLARSRLETAVFQSPLAMQVNLTLPETEARVEELRVAYGIR